jgi:hypothetical protein
VIPGVQPEEPVKPSAPPRVVTFTITDKNGAVLFYAAMPAECSGLQDGRMVRSLQPREGGYFEEEIPREIKDPTRLANGPEISSALDGIVIETADGKWKLEQCLGGARKITETLTGHTEQPAGKDYTSENVPVSCERLVMKKEKYNGKLPEPGAEEKLGLDGARILTVRVR